MSKLQENVIEEVATTVGEAVDAVDNVVDETYDAISGKSKVLKVILAPFKLIWEVTYRIGRFGIKRTKIFGSKFRRFTNYATDDEKGPIIRFTSWLFFRIGMSLGIVGGLVLQHYVDVVQFVIDLFS